MRFFFAVFEQCDMWFMKYYIEYAIFFTTLPRELTPTHNGAKSLLKKILSVIKFKKKSKYILKKKTCENINV